jgi:uncharacterized protein YprB with RNaseH-like and TPR domain
LEVRLSGSLRDRLKRIQLVKQSGGSVHQPAANKSVNNVPENAGLSFFEERGWVSSGYQTLRREITCGSVKLPVTMPESAGIVMPGITGDTAYEDLLFFDLETSGLSGGAGTVAFLAAFGRLVHERVAKPKTAFYKLRITQYLLLDFPGEADFVEALLGEFKHGSGRAGGTRADGTVTMVSYNGKCFDSQILKTRCLMNGIIPPEYHHADLLHPSRRLWKKLLPDCSQGTVETEILGLDRTGDIPGAMAPEIWFSFLKNGDACPLLEICEHNRRDIAGLAAIFSAMARIADDPFTAVVNYDPEPLSLCWYYAANRGQNSRLLETGKKLLAFAAGKGCPRATLQYGLMLLGTGKYVDGRKWLLKAAGEDRPPAVQAGALRALAIDSERRLKDPAAALGFALRGLEMLPADSPHRFDFEKRVGRLRGKISPIF